MNRAERQRYRDWQHAAKQADEAEARVAELESALREMLTCRDSEVAGQLVGLDRRWAAAELKAHEALAFNEGRSEC